MLALFELTIKLHKYIYSLRHLSIRKIYYYIIEIILN